MVLRIIIESAAMVIGVTALGYILSALCRREKDD